MRIAGFRRVKFTAKDGTIVEGVSVYLGEPIPPGQGEGESVEKVFFSAGKLAASGYQPKLDDEVEVLYNKYGRPYLIREITVG